MRDSDNPNDKVYTPHHIVDEVLSIFMPLVEEGHSILEPFKGDGAFFNKLPSADWCEIDQGVDFMDVDKRYDWIITNPPYSTFSTMFRKMLSVADNILILIPVNKLLSSMPRMMDMKDHGFGIKRIHYVGSGRQVGFPFGFPVAAVLIVKNQHEDIAVTYSERCSQVARK